MYTVKRVWLDNTEEPREGSVDVLAEMEDETIWLARFATIPYLQEQMKYGFEVSHDLRNTPAARYATIETQHIIVDCLNMETIENVIDNLLELGVFESMFARVNNREITDYLGSPMIAAR
ncbi:MAG: hypothetical protein JXN59_09805 [Anaerolineae bacterium]|nr:hypothetical protein [Anaerolineae bacterium]